MDKQERSSFETMTSLAEVSKQFFRCRDHLAHAKIPDVLNIHSVTG